MAGASSSSFSSSPGPASPTAPGAPGPLPGRDPHTFPPPAGTGVWHPAGPDVELPAPRPPRQRPQPRGTLLHGRAASLGKLRRGWLVELRKGTPTLPAPAPPPVLPALLPRAPRVSRQCAGVRTTLWVSLKGFLVFFSFQGDGLFDVFCCLQVNPGLHRAGNKTFEERQLRGVTRSSCLTLIHGQAQPLSSPPQLVLLVPSPFGRWRCHRPVGQARPRTPAQGQALRGDRSDSTEQKAKQTPPLPQPLFLCPGGVCSETPQHRPSRRETPSHPVEMHC